MYIASFDIGKKNFAFVIEDVDEDAYQKINDVTKKYKPDGTPTDEYSEILKQISTLSKVVLIKNIDLTVGCEKKYFDSKLYINMTDCLNSFKEYWEKCSVILIEQQMDFGRTKRNPMARKLGQHCYSYFSIFYRDVKTLLEYPAYHKTQVLGAPKKFGTITKTYKNGKTVEIKDNRKKWSVRFTTDVLERRQDKDSLEILQEKSKQDDMSDCILMIMSYCVLKYIIKNKKIGY
jgi:hypothetical protein